MDTQDIKRVQEIVSTDNNASEQTPNIPTDNGKKKKKTTPDLQPVSFKTCVEYKKYVEGGAMDDNPTLKHNPVPEDALTLSGLGKMSDGEILGILNKMSKTTNKSDIRVMYANGYGFTWTQLTVIAEFKGYQIDNPGTLKPHYSMSGVDEVVIDKSFVVSDEQDGVIFINHGKRETKERKYSLSKDTIDKLDALLNGLAPIEKSKATDVIISSSLDKYLEYKHDGCFHVAYRPTDMEVLI